MLMQIVHNTTLLISLLALYSLLIRYRDHFPKWNKVISGLMFGGIAILGMLNPFQYAPGIIFDGRSIVLTLAGLFGGGTVAGVSMLMAGIYRLGLGGPGVWAGLATIWSCGMLGLLFRRIAGNKPCRLRLLHLLGIGILIHIVMLMCQLLIPWPAGLTVIHRIWLPILLIMPAATAIMGGLLSGAERAFQSEQELRERTRTLQSSENRLRLAQRMANMGTWEWDIHSDEVIWPPETEAVFGLEAGSYDGSMDMLTSIIHPEDLPGWLESVRACASGQRPHDSVFRIRTANGGIRWLHGYGDIVRDERGQATRMLGVVSDITEHHEMRRAFQEATSKYEQLFNSIGTGVAVYEAVDDGKDFVIANLNRTGQLLSQADLNQIRGKRVTEVFPAVKDIGLLDVLTRVWKTGNPETLPLRKYEDGRITEWVENQVYKLPSGEVVAVYEDTTEVEKAREETRAFFETNIDLLCIADFDGNFVRLNPEWERTLGYKTADLEGKPFMDLVHPDDREATLKALEQQERGGDVDGFINRYRHRDGSWRWIEWRSRPGDGFVYASARDITDEHLARLRLAESEERFRMLFTNMEEGFAAHEMIYNEEGNPVDYRFLNVNPAFERMTGLKADEIIDKRVKEVMPEIEDYWIERYGEVARTGKPISFDAPSRELGKHYMVTAFRPAPDQFACAVMDVTDLVSTQKQLKESERRFRHTFEQAAVGIAHVAPDGRWLRVNEKLSDITGYTTAELVNLRFQDITHPDDLEADLVHVERLLSGTSDTDSMEKRYIRKDGTPVWVNLTVSVVRDAHDNPEYLISVVEDISHRKQIEEEIRRLNRELEDRVAQRTRDLETANRELEAFAYSVSHDLKAPLRAIQGFAEIIRERFKDELPPRGQQYFDNIVEAGTHMHALIEDLLRYSRLGRTAVRQEIVQLQPLLTEVMETLKNRINDTGARITVPDDLPVIRGDRTLLKVIFYNLIENALTYHQPDRKPELTISWEESEHGPMIHVADNGIGIPPEHHEKIFDIFQRLHPQSRYPGTGIGLGLVKKAAELMNAQVSLASDIDSGSVFTVEF